MKISLLTLFLIFIYFFSHSQNNENFKIKIFNKDLYEQKIMQSKLLQNDTLLVSKDSTYAQNQKSNDMRVYSPQGNYAPMPNADIKEDVNYTMLIKGYEKVPPDTSITDYSKLKPFKFRIGYPLPDSTKTKIKE